MNCFSTHKKDTHFCACLLLERVNEKDIFKNVSILEVCFDPGYTANTEGEMPASTPVTEEATEQE